MTEVTNYNHSLSNSISVVVPVYQSAKILPKLYDRLKNTLEKSKLDWEVIFVDDSSPDSSWDELVKIQAKDNRVRIIQFSYNHGQQFATLCGLGHAHGSYVVTIDDDLQCHPEDIPLFVEKLKMGFHAVIGRISSSNKKHAWWRNIGSRLNSFIISKALNKPSHLSLSSFRGFSRFAVNSITSYKGAHPHIAALMLRTVPHKYIGNVNIQHSAREDNSPSSYSFRKLLKTASYIIINHSYAPLRIVIAWGAIVSVLSILFAIGISIRAIFHGSSVAGWASLATLISFLSGNTLLALGVIGEYVGRLVEENSKLQQYVIFEKKG